MEVMSNLLRPPNIKQSTAAGDESLEPSVSSVPNTVPSMNRIIEACWVRDDMLRFDVDCVRQKRDRIEIGDYRRPTAVSSRRAARREN